MNLTEKQIESLDMTLEMAEMAIKHLITYQTADANKTFAENVLKRIRSERYMFTD